MLNFIWFLIGIILYFTWPLFVRDSLDYIATGYGLEDLGFESSVLASFSWLIQTSTDAHTNPCKMGTYLFPGDTAGEWSRPPTTFWPPYGHGWHIKGTALTLVIFLFKKRDNSVSTAIQLRTWHPENCSSSLGKSRLLFTSPKPSDQLGNPHISCI
jgi:hypothetical protein